MGLVWYKNSFAATPEAGPGVRIDEWPGKSSGVGQRATHGTRQEFFLERGKGSSGLACEFIIECVRSWPGSYSGILSGASLKIGFGTHQMLVCIPSYVVSRVGPLPRALADLFPKL